MNSKLVYWVWLTTLLEFSSSRIAPVYYKFSPEEAYNASMEELLYAGINEKDASILQDKNLDRARAIIEKCESLGIKIVTCTSPLYPRALERLDDKPYVLYVKGNTDCLKKKTAAFVGTRSMTRQGREVATLVAKELIHRGYTLISGVAIGIDSVAARVSLEEKKPFCAVLAVDIDKYYPRSTKSLVDEIAGSGVVISEYPPDANARYFPTRNRIMAGLADEVYVIEAPQDSGAIITANFAKRMGIKIYAYDGEGVTFIGCNGLIKSGATPIGKTNAKEKRMRKKKIEGLSGIKLYIYERLSEKNLSDNELIDENHPVAEVLTALTELELDGILTALPGGKYKLN